MFTNEEMANLYLYGQKTRPYTLLDEKLIRDESTGTLTSTDINEYMAGPGRFANPAFFKVLDFFFNDSSILQPGSYSENDLRGIWPHSNTLLSQQQWAYSDGKNDFANRVFIWNTVAFEIDDSAQFVVPSHGDRYITNFAIRPYSQNGDENFDFTSRDHIASLGASHLQSNVDPWDIGRIVEIGFRNPLDFAATYTKAEYFTDAGNAKLPNPLNLISLSAAIEGVIDELWESGSTRFVDDTGRAVIFGTEKTDHIDVLWTGVNEKILEAGLNGVAVISGDGDDFIVGTDNGDFIDAGPDNDVIFTAEATFVIYETGNDVVIGGSGADEIHAGGGSDVLSGGGGDDVFYLSRPAPSFARSTAGPNVSVVWGGDGNDEFHFQGGADILLLDTPYVSDDLLKNLDVASLQDAIGNTLTSRSFTYILVNVESTDNIFLDDELLTQATGETELDTYDDPPYFQYAFSGEYTADPILANGFAIWRATSTLSEHYQDTYRNLVFTDIDADAYASVEDGYSVVRTGKSGTYISLTGFENGTAGISVIGNAPEYEWKTTTTINDITVTSYLNDFDQDTRRKYERPTNYVVNQSHVTEETEAGDNLKPDGFDQNNHFQIDLRQFIKSTNEQGTAYDDGFAGSTATQSYSGGDGTDSVDYSSSDAAVQVNLSLGSATGGYAEGDAFLDIEGVFGSAFNDTITGSNSDNELFGYDGDDSFVATAGLDDIDGGNGFDNVIFEAPIGTFSVTVLDGVKVQVLGSAGTTTVANVETISFQGPGLPVSEIDVTQLLISNGVNGDGNDNELVGTNAGELILGYGGDDTILALGGNDTVFSGDGDDVVFPNSGDDVIDAGTGSDTIIFEGWSTDFKVDYIDGSTIGVSGTSGTTTVKNAEWVVFDQPSDGPNAGFNVATFIVDHAPIKLSGTGSSDVLTASNGHDVIEGKEGDDTIFAKNGNDSISGGDGDDVIFPGIGNDNVDGGDGSDAVIINGTYSDFVIRAMSDNSIFIDGPNVHTRVSNVEWLTFDQPGTDPDIGLDVASFIEINLPREIRGTESDDSLIGADGNDVIVGSGGNDQIFGDKGDDLLTGNDGDDVIFPDEGQDYVDGGAGVDTVIFNGRRSDFNVAVFDGSIVRVSGPDVGTFVTNAEWIVFDAPEGEPDESINVLDFIGQNNVSNAFNNLAA